ncbi:MAG: DNA internalization-related competence protein ComEC/Rec2 [Chloroflexi bacterium]|nr:DNA internalization-related competence protein ComEC/Rec2 [Chloroflexota bacterium]
MLLIYLSVAWVAGIWLGSELFEPGFRLPWPYLLAGLIPLLLLFFARQYRKPIILASLCLLALLGGAIYYQSRLPLASEGSLPPEWVSHLRTNLAQVIVEVLPEPQASLAQGIVLGIRSNIPKSLLADFNHTGTTHLLAISGQNLSIIAGILVGFGIWLFGRRHYLYIWLALGIIWLYALLTGMNPPVVRATIMASVFLAADLMGRQHSAATALFFTAAVMVGVSPGVLGEASFQLSFMAMAGLIFIFPLLQSLGHKAVKNRLGEDGRLVSAVNLIVDSFSVSLGTIIAVWPLIAHYFGIISWIGPVATFFALPALPAIIVTGVLTGFIGLIALPVALVVAWLTWLFLSYMLLVVRVFSSVPFSEGVRIDPALIWVYYSVLALVVWLGNDRDMMTKIWEWLKSGAEKSGGLFSKLPVKWAVPSLSVVAILVWAAVFTLPDGNLHASFLDVGQGDATLFQKGGQQVLIDGGPSEQAIVLALGKEMPFWDRTIDLVILTHPDADHYDGLVEVLKRYKVKRVLYAKPDEQSSVYRDWFKSISELLTLVEEKNIEFTLAQAGQQITFGSASIEVLNPPGIFSGKADSDIDNNGVVVRVEAGAVSFLIPGDVQWQAESEMIIRRANLASTVLKAGHHGSRTSTSQGFLGAVDPSVAIISAGKNNPYGHPHKEVMDRLKEKVGEKNIYRTDENGRIELITNGKRLWVKVER